MNPASEPLQLRDIHLPADIAWWPPAPGWWLLLGVLVLCIVLGIYAYRYWLARQVRRAATRELNMIKTNYLQAADDPQLLQAVSVWLRRVCLSCYPRREVAGLTGQEWLAFLDQQLSKSKQAQRFNSDIGQALLKGPYQQTTQVDAEKLLLLCQLWLRHLPYQRRRLL